MRKAKIRKFKEGKGIKSVTLLWNPILRIKGKLDSRKGATVPDAYIEKLKDRCAFNENAEVLFAEEILNPTRIEATGALSLLKDNLALLDTIPDLIMEQNANDVRANRLNNNRRFTAQSEIQTATTKLLRINEQIINIDTILEERCTKTKNKALEKIDVYISGVRAGKLKNYSSSVVLGDGAYKLYIKKHEAGDTLISDFISNTLN